ncbi:hypothetical protein DM860_003397 [Cuscuta australis]|uniref:Chorismate mutase n=1 Tax=Cuscuta australis TaxID=267555 RepID=A0A328DJ27_9ASTE|nr:hypothetical protein DM860_003397 [Cuscuta australis]
MLASDQFTPPFHFFTMPSSITRIMISIINNGAIMIIMSFVANLCLVGKTMGAATYHCSNVTLDSARDSLVRQEDTIIFSLIERAKFPVNTPLYAAAGDKSPPFSGPGSLFQYFVNQSEALQSQMGRYSSKEELPFFPSQLPNPFAPSSECVSYLYPKAADVNASTNVNSMIWNFYLTGILHNFTKAGSDENYASTAMADLLCLQALSRRIHYGRFVAEAKFSSAPDQYKKLIHAKNKEALENLLTNRTVEEQVKKRVWLKAREFAKEVTLNNTKSGSGEYKIDPIQVSNLYENWVIPLTKKVEVEYLLRRLN